MKNKTKVVIIIIIVMALIVGILFLLTQANEESHNKDNNLDNLNYIINKTGLDEHNLFDAITAKLTMYHSILFNQEYENISSFTNNINNKEDLYNFYKIDLSNVYELQFIIEEIKSVNNYDLGNYFLFVKGSISEYRGGEYDEIPLGYELFNTDIYYLITVDKRNNTMLIDIIDEKIYSENEIDIRDDMYSEKTIEPNELNVLDVTPVTEIYMVNTYFYNLVYIYNNDETKYNEIVDNQTGEDIFNEYTGTIKNYSVENDKIVVLDDKNNIFEFTINTVLDYTVKITKNN